MLHRQIRLREALTVRCVWSCKDHAELFALVTAVTIRVELKIAADVFVGVSVTRWHFTVPHVTTTAKSSWFGFWDLSLQRPIGPFYRWRNPFSHSLATSLNRRIDRIELFFLPSFSKSSKTPDEVNGTRGALALRLTPIASVVAISQCRCCRFYKTVWSHAPDR